MNEKSLIEARSIIADFLKLRRIQLGYTQEYIAYQTGLGIATIKRSENGHFWLGTKQLILICGVLKVQVDFKTDFESVL